MRPDQYYQGRGDHWEKKSIITFTTNLSRDRVVRPGGSSPSEGEMWVGTLLLLLFLDSKGRGLELDEQDKA